MYVDLNLPFEKMSLLKRCSVYRALYKKEEDNVNFTEKFFHVKKGVKCMLTVHVVVLLASHKNGI